MFKRHLCRRREKQANKLASAKGWSAWRTSFAKLDLNGGKWRKWKNLTKLCYICCIVGQCQWYWYSAITITTCCFNPPQKYDNLENAPLQSAVLQASAWTGSPRHCPLPPGSLSAHARFLHRVPWPQEVEHWLHSPHGCQLPGWAGTSLRNLNWEPFLAGNYHCIALELSSSLDQRQGMLKMVLKWWLLWIWQLHTYEYKTHLCNHLSCKMQPRQDHQGNFCCLQDLCMSAFSIEFPGRRMLNTGSTLPMAARFRQRLELLLKMQNNGLISLLQLLDFWQFSRRNEHAFQFMQNLGRFFNNTQGLHKKIGPNF